MQRDETQAAAEEAEAGSVINPHTPVRFAAMHGLQVGGKVRDGQLFELSTSGIKFHGPMTWDRWCELLRMIRQCKSSATMWLADALTQGQTWFGFDRVESAMVQLQFDLADATQAIGIGGLTPGVRRDALNSEHYWVIAKALLSAADQIKWAVLAEKHEMTPHLLGASIAAGAVLTEVGLADKRGSRTGFVTIEGLRQQFDIWQRTATKDHPLAEWSRDEKLHLWEELEAPARLGLQLARELGISLEEVAQ